MKYYIALTLGFISISSARAEYLSHCVVAKISSSITKPQSVAEDVIYSIACPTQYREVRNSGKVARDIFFAAKTNNLHVNVKIEPQSGEPSFLTPGGSTYFVSQVELE